MESMPFGSLAIPVVVATLAVVVLSCLAHMVLPHHRKDFQGLPDEGPVLDAVRRPSVSAGMYMVPHCKPEDRKNPDVQAKFKQGPLVLLAVVTKFGMGQSLATWTGYCFLVSLLTATVARHVLQPGADPALVLRVTTLMAAIGHVASHLPNTAWKGQPWTMTLKSMADGLVYALATGAAFAWLWPKA